MHINLTYRIAANRHSPCLATNQELNVVFVHYYTRSSRERIQRARSIWYILKNGEDVSRHGERVDKGQRFRKRTDLIGFQASLKWGAQEYDAFEETFRWSQEKMSIFLGEF